MQMVAQLVAAKRKLVLTAEEGKEDFSDIYQTNCTSSFKQNHIVRINRDPR